ncbi:RidA family protein [Amycolatopsis jejuensis]|uniref:RidA family protein n=1 Tax=Amycolatopsis jejuensis TaxID=330084 RepID=UPI0005243780|nr:RidA family protein [Amycolatopsis jejuensis]
MPETAQRYFSTWPNEELAGYARVVRCGSLIMVAGTTATDGGTVVAPGDMYAQTKFVLGKIAASLQEAGGSLAEVIQTRAYLTMPDGFPEFARAHREVFARIRPVNTSVAVSALADPQLLVEIEATAFLGSRPALVPPA